MATLPDWGVIGKGQKKFAVDGSQWRTFLTNAAIPGTEASKIVQAFGSPEAYRDAVNKYDIAYKQYVADTYEQNYERMSANPTATAGGVEGALELAEKARAEADAAPKQIEEKQKYDITSAMQKQAAKDPYYAAQLADPNLLKLVVDDPDRALKLRQESRANAVSSVRTQLENQYNNLVSADSRFGYAGRNADLNAVFNQQAAQLADAGVTNIGDLRIQDGRLVNSATGKVVSTSNLGGQVAVDRDTGVQKWGDIFSGVEGGANYGIMQSPDGSVLLFPAWEKTKSLAAQIGGRELEKYITPLLTVAGAYFGAPGISNAIGAAAGGAAIGSTAGQLLASGEVDWEKVALSAGVAGAGAYVSGLLAPEAAAAGQTTGAAGSAADAAFIAEDAANLFAQTGDINAVQQGLIGAGVDPVIAAEAANLASYGFSGTQIASNLPTSMIGEIYGPSANTLRIQDLSFVGDDAAQLWKQTGDVAAVQQNLIAAGVDPIIAADASNLAAFGQSGPTITANLNQAFPSDVVFTSEGLLSGGSTLDEFAKDIGGNITSSAAAGLGIKDVLNMARTGMQLFGGQQQGLLGGGMGGGGGQTAAGVDYSGLLSLLQGKARTPGVSPLIAPVASPVASPYDPLLGQQPQYQSLLGRTQQSLLG